MVRIFGHVPHVDNRPPPQNYPLLSVFICAPSAA